MALGTTLVVAVLVATLGLIMASASITHLQLMARMHNEATARDLARSALHLAIDRVFTRAEYGTAGESLEVALPGVEGVAVLAFGEPEAELLKLSRSTNNLLGASSVTAADGQTVPAEACYLVAEGRCRGVTRRVEAILARPPFPYAVASDGPIVSAGGLEVGSRDPADPARLLPADVLSNAPGQSVVLGPECTIKGDIRAHGQIQLDPAGGTLVEGQVLPNQDASEVPPLEAASFDPGATAAPLQAHYTRADLTGRLRSSGPVTVAGDLALEGALLYVDGDLTVGGSLTGSGIVVTTGRLTVGAQADVAAADKVALLAQGGIRLQGQGKSGSRLRGLVYTEGPLEATQIRLEGALVAREAQSQVSLRDVAVLRDPAASRVEVQTGAGGDLQGLVGKYVFMDDQGHVAVGHGGAWQQLPDPSRDYYKVFVRPAEGSAVNISICRDQMGEKAIDPNSFRNIYQDDVVLADLAAADASALQRLLADLGNPSPTQESAPGLMSPAAVAGLLAMVVSSNSASPGQTGVYVVNLSQVLPLAQAARILLWREP